jgi:hypothetical protein
MAPSRSSAASRTIDRTQMIEGKYTIELCTPGGPYNGIEGVIASDDDLAIARKLYLPLPQTILGTSCCCVRRPDSRSQR